MEIEVAAGGLGERKADGGIVFLFEKGSWKAPPGEEWLAAEIGALRAGGAFKGKSGEVHALLTGGKLGLRWLYLAGLGKRERFTPEILRQAAGKIASLAHETRLRTLLLPLPPGGGGVAETARAAAEGLLLGAYRFTRYLTEKEKEEKHLDSVVILVGNGRLALPARRAAAVGTAVASGVNWARETGNLPGNDLTPRALADAAAALGKEAGFDVKVLDEKEVAKLGMGGLLGVARGSEEPCRFIVAEYRGGGKKAPLLAFVGKAITFDSGGISIKPAEDMHKMKYDKSGGVAVLGALRAIAALRLKVNVVVVVPATENLPGGRAYKPGDILKTMAGKTVEVINTDAEGRLILADALAYAKNLKPGLMVDLATLTGACVVALGSHAAGLFSNNPKAERAILSAAKRAGERVWPLPLWEEYGEAMKSDSADLKNSGGREGGAITAAYFLGRFTEGVPWAHLDIAGMAWEDKGKGYNSQRGVTGFGVRTLVEVARAFR